MKKGLTLFGLVLLLSLTFACSKPTDTTITSSETTVSEPGFSTLPDPNKVETPAVDQSQSDGEVPYDSNSPDSE